MSNTYGGIKIKVRTVHIDKLSRDNNTNTSADLLVLTSLWEFQFYVQFSGD